MGEWISPLQQVDDAGWRKAGGCVGKKNGKERERGREGGAKLRIKVGEWIELK